MIWLSFKFNFIKISENFNKKNKYEKFIIALFASAISLFALNVNKECVKDLKKAGKVKR